MTPANARFTAHGVFVAVDGLGVLLRGTSGVGKSEIGLELISRGHRLIADDAVEFQIEAGRLCGRCPPLLEGFIEVRGLGILDVRRMYGDAAVGSEAPLDLVIDLSVRPEVDADERIDGQRSVYRLLGREVPEISLPRRVGHNLAVLVEAACRDHRLRRDGYIAADELVARQSRLTLAQNS
jgi:HPr kinase/phosphorylase